MATGNYSYWKNCLTMIRAGTGITVDNSDPLKPIINATGGGGGGGIESVVAGDNVTVDDTDPLNPIINARGGLPFKTIVWTAYATASEDDPADVVIDVKFNNTGRTVSYDTIDYSGFYLSGVFTEAYFIGMNQGSGLGGMDIGSSEWNRPNFGVPYIGIGLGTPNKLFKWSNDGSPDNAVTFKIEIYE
mgnify:CR=1 FL=1